MGQKCFLLLSHKHAKYLFYKKECGTNLKISFATDSRVNGIQKSFFSEISKKTSNTKSVLLVFFSNSSNRNNFCLDLITNLFSLIRSLFLAIRWFHKMTSPKFFHIATFTSEKAALMISTIRSLA